ncbi:MAG: hypothetical protein ACXAEN_23815 [Candidatus Thorarchaeota archaeon]|jgi:hypothetical protein
MKRKPNPGNRKRKRNVANPGQRGRERQAWKPFALDLFNKRLRQEANNAHDAIHRLAVAIKEEVDLEVEESFWERAIPLALYVVLEKFDSVSSYKAAAAFIDDVYNLDD